ncbi:MAG: 2OG-Fe(II) oxygenase [Sphingomonadales bacterium]
MIAVSYPNLKPAIVYNTNEQHKEVNVVRTNSSSTFHLNRQDFLLNFLARKIMYFSGEPLANGEQLVVLKYAPGEEYKPHFDFLDPRVPGLKEEVEVKGQRIKTVMVYLNEDFEGGETEFVTTEKTFRGPTGDGLLFHNVIKNGAPCLKSRHAGRPVLKGEKWLAVRWIREKPLLGLG